MRKNLRKSIKIYLREKIQKQAMPLASTATSRLMSTCRHPRTPSLSLNINGPLTSFKASTNHGESTASFKNPDDGQHAATLSDVERFLFENFNSLFVQEGSQAKAIDQQTYMEPSHPPPPPSPSKRYFIFPETDGRNLNRKIAPEGTKSADGSSSSGTTINDESTVAMRTLSVDPCNDFRRSMEEMMVVQRGCSLCTPLDWDFMEELLLCYLDINDQSVHRYILEAFGDLAASTRRRLPATMGRRKVSDQH